MHSVWQNNRRESALAGVSSRQQLLLQHAFISMPTYNTMALQTQQEQLFKLRSHLVATSGCPFAVMLLLG
jgi:hypothetical protein